MFMKKMMLILLAALMTGGCSQTPQPDVQEPVPSPAVSSAPSPGISAAPPVETKTVILESDEHTITFEIPVSYTTEDNTPDQAKEIIVKDGTASIITVGTGLFGVCGTGLTEEKTMINDKEVIVGYYDGSPEWSFAVFVPGKPAVYALNQIAEGDHSAADMILQSIRVK